MKKCLSCNQIVPDDSLFCPYCGSNQIDEIVDKTVKYCQDCGKKIPKESEKCVFCGSKNIAVFKNGIDIIALNNSNLEKKKNNLENELRIKTASISEREWTIEKTNKKLKVFQILACLFALAFIIAIVVGIHNYNSLMADYNCLLGVSRYCK